MSKEVHNKNLEELTEDNIKAYDDIHNDLTPEQAEHYMNDEWTGHGDKPEEGGTRKLAHDAYTTGIKHMFASNIHEKQDEETILGILREYIVPLLNNSKLSGAMKAAKVYDAMIKNGEFKNASEQKDYLLGMANNYLGLQKETLDNLVKALESGDKNVIRHHMKEVRDKYSEAIVQKYINLKIAKVTSTDEDKDKFNSYSIKKISEKHGKEPESLGKALLDRDAFAKLQKYDIDDYKEKVEMDSNYKKTGTDN